MLTNDIKHWVKQSTEFWNNLYWRSTA